MNSTNDGNVDLVNLKVKVIKSGPVRCYKTNVVAKENDLLNKRTQYLVGNALFKV